MTNVLLMLTCLSFFVTCAAIDTDPDLVSIRVDGKLRVTLGTADGGSKIAAKAFIVAYAESDASRFRDGAPIDSSTVKTTEWRVSCKCGDTNADCYVVYSFKNKEMKGAEGSACTSSSLKFERVKD